jgi:hypothetical protein
MWLGLKVEELDSIFWLFLSNATAPKPHMEAHPRRSVAQMKILFYLRQYHQTVQADLLIISTIGDTGPASYISESSA